MSLMVKSAAPSPSAPKNIVELEVGVTPISANDSTHSVVPEPRVKFF